MINVTIERKHVYLIAIIAMVAAFLIPAGAYATSQFNDVPNSNGFHNDIDWVKAAGVTLGCGDGTNYCPSDNVTREQMAAFMKRLATNQVVDAKEVGGGTAWMWASNAAATIGTPLSANGTYAYNSQGAAVTYTRTAVGAYKVTFPGMGTGTIGNVQVTTYNTAGVSCQTSGWSGDNVNVRCYNSSGALANARFTVLASGS